MLDVDRLADAVLLGAKALIAKEIAPLVAANTELREANIALEARIAGIEAKDILGMAKAAESSTRAAIEAIESFEPTVEVGPILEQAASAAKEAASAEFRDKSAEIDARLAALEAREIPPAFDPEPFLGEMRLGIESAKNMLPDIPGMVKEAVSEALAAVEPPQAPDIAGEVKAAVEAAVSGIEQPERDWMPEIRAAVDEVRKEMPVLPDPPDLSGFVKQGELDDRLAHVPNRDELRDWAHAIDAGVDALRKEIPAPVEVPDLSGFATKDDLAAVEAKIVPVEQKDFTPEIEAVRREAAAATEAVRREIPKLPEVIHGRDGAGVVEVKQNADGELIVKLSNGETINAGKVRGEDGLGFEDMSVDWDGERELTFSFTRDGRSEVTRLTIPAIIYRGIWREGPFQRGDSVTWGGSLWIAQRDTEDKPETSDAWKLSAKRGRDGKDFRPQEDPGPIRVGTPKK